MPGYDDTYNKKAVFYRIQQKKYSVNRKDKKTENYQYSDNNYTGYDPDIYFPNKTYWVKYTDNFGTEHKYTFDSENNYKSNYEVRKGNSVVLSENYSYNNQKWNHRPIEIISEKDGVKSYIDYEYNSYGEVTKSIGPFHDKEKAIKDKYQTTYSYGEYGQNTEKVYRENDNREIKEIYVLDKNTKKTVTEAWKREKASGKNMSKTAFLYNQQGEMILKNEYRTDNTRIQTAFTHEYTKEEIKETITQNNIVNVNQYNIMGQLISQKDGRGNTTKYEYDKRGMLKSTTDPLNNKISTNYNYKNNQLDISKDIGVKTTYIYDQAGNLLTVTNANGIEEIKNEYDENMRLSKQTVNTKNRTEYQYDPLGRVTSKKIFDVSSGEELYNEKTSYSYYD